MYITSYKRSGRSEPLFIFRFKDDRDLECTVQSWLVHADGLSDEEDKQRFNELVIKIQNRADSKYTTEDSALSSSLFYDEFVYFSDYLAYLLGCAISFSELNEMQELIQNTSWRMQQLQDIYDVFLNAQKTGEECEATLNKIFAIVVRKHESESK